MKALWIAAFPIAGPARAAPMRGDPDNICHGIPASLPERPLVFQNVQAPSVTKGRGRQVVGHMSPTYD